MIFVHFVENWYWCYLFSIWSGNVTLFEDDGQVVYVCLCACMSASEMCVDRATENERGRLSLCFFFSLSPSLLPEGQGFESECIVKTEIDCFFVLRRRATCQLLRNQTFKKPRQTCKFFLDTRFKSRLNWQGFEIHLICGAFLPSFLNFPVFLKAFKLHLTCLSCCFQALMLQLCI